jgi:hypothetical protein
VGFLAAVVLACADVPPPPDAAAGPGPKCTPPAAWPALPTVATIAGRSADYRPGVIDSAKSVLLDTMPVDASVAVPQYAFYRAKGANVCEPVIVVRAATGGVEYWGVDLTSQGTAERGEIELLGTTPRAGRSR